MFILEALQADFGDSLLLHYGTAADPKAILIDGGPKAVYKDTLKSRLAALKQERSPNAPLPIPMLMVSHIDGDHVGGILELTKELIQKDDDGQELPYDVETLWHNSFDDLIGNENDELAARLQPAIAAVAAGGEVPANIPVGTDSALILATVPQGRRLRKDAQKLSWNVNKGFTGLVQAPNAGLKQVDFAGGLQFTVIGPREQQLKDLQAEWNRVITEMGVAQPAEAQAMAAAFLDKSAANLSSLVVVAAADGKRMLLTGDARGDFILEGLAAAGLMQNNKVHFDLFKLPHHGSDRNVSTSFFKKVRADHYVVSADGTHDNPDLATLKMISEARPDDQFTIHLTNREQRLVNFFAQENAAGRSYKVMFRQDGSPSISVALA